MNESNNEFVSSRGILKSCDYFSTTPHSSIRQLINYPHYNILEPFIDNFRWFIDFQSTKYGFIRL